MEEDLKDLKELWDGAWILDPSYLSGKRSRDSGICTCGDRGEMLFIGLEYSFWLCRSCVYL